MFASSSVSFGQLNVADYMQPDEKLSAGALLEEGKKSLPKLAGFLEKRSPNVFARWQKRYFTVAEYNIFYGASEACDVNDMLTGLASGMSCMPLFVVFSIESLLGNDGRDFCIRGRDMGKGRYREYLLRATTRKERDAWITGLRQHKEHLDKILKCSDVRLTTERAPTQ